MKRLIFVLAASLIFMTCENYDLQHSNPVENPLLPVLTTTAVTGVTTGAAISGGSIASDGGLAVIARGVCWSTKENPTISDNKTTDGEGAGSFTSVITGLSANTIYYVRAYATNSAGTGYGNQVSMRTYIIMDIDGNGYHSIIIGTQEWLIQNLKTTRYRNGDTIPNVTNNGAWSDLNAGAYCNYDNDTNNAEIYGRLYNWYAINDNRNIAPAGWHVPTDNDWKTLEMYLGMTQQQADTTHWRGTNQGNKLKEAGHTHWASPNGGTNSSGFTALPGGYRYNNGAFASKNFLGLWWTSSGYDGTYARYRYLEYSNAKVFRGLYYKSGGFSVRCIKD